MIQLTSTLYQGAKIDADEAAVRPVGIGHILRVDVALRGADPLDTNSLFFRLWDYNCLYCPFDDNGHSLTQEKLNLIGSFAVHVAANRDPLLVHCAAGQNRSVMTCAYLLVTVYGYTPDDAVALIRQKHTDLKVYETLVMKMKALTDLNFRGLL